MPVRTGVDGAACAAATATIDTVTTARTATRHAKGRAAMARPFNVLMLCLVMLSG